MRVSLRACSALIALASVAIAPFAFASTPSTGVMTTSSQPISWTGTAIGTGAADPAAAVEGVTSDTFTLTVGGLPSDWANKVITVDFSWVNSLNDYDVYVHKDSNANAAITVSGGGTPQTGESVTISPSDTGVGVYTIQVVYYLVTPLIDQYKATARVGSNKAIYLKGGITFSPNWTVKAPTAEAEGEPSARTDFLGNHYVASIRGVPAGIDLWYFDLNPNSPTYDPYMRNPIYRGQPDSFTKDEAYALGADGGGDVDLAVGRGLGPNGVPTLAFTSLVTANISSAVSNDLGKTWTLNPLGNVTGGAPVDDRQWLEFLGSNVVYMIYRTFQPAVSQIQRSTDGGLTWGPARTVGQIGQVGGIDVDQRDGTVYVSGGRGMVGVGVPAAPGQEPLLYTAYTVAAEPSVANLFFTVKVADDGTVYACYSDGKNVLLKYSKNKGATWSPAFRVNDGPETKTAMLPWMETGPVPGSVAVVWYGTSAEGNVAGAEWNVFMAQGFSANTISPVFRQVQVSDHPIHAGIISTEGTLGDQNRNLLDYFQVTFDPLGAATVAYTDDHNDYSGFTFVSRQVSGPAIDGKKLKKPKEGSSLPPASPLSADGAQVVDFEKDVAIGLLAVVPQDSPLDILSIKYSSESGPDGPVIVGTMTVKTLADLQPGLVWRMNFTANAPHAGLNGSGQYSNALNDLGDKFYLRAQTAANGTVSYRWGTYARNTDGTITHTERGAADGGSFDPATRTITVKLSANKLSPYLSAGGPVGSGSVLSGLMGQAFSLDANALRDSTRGGTEYVIP